MIWYSMQRSENIFIEVILVLRDVKEITILKAEIFLIGKNIDEPKKKKKKLRVPLMYFF